MTKIYISFCVIYRLSLVGKSLISNGEDIPHPDILRSPPKADYSRMTGGIIFLSGIGQPVILSPLKPDP
jgi:hypothetical protein